MLSWRLKRCTIYKTIILLSRFSLMRYIEPAHSVIQTGLNRDGFHKNPYPTIANDGMGFENVLFNPKAGTALSDRSLGTAPNKSNE